MTIRDSIALRRHTTAVRWAGSIGILAAAAAVAGLGSVGNFTDSTSPVNTAVETGVLSIDVSRPDGSAASLFPGGLFVAGDARSTPVDLVNDGDTALGSVALTSRAEESSALDSDPVNGLRLTVESCSQPWDAAGSAYSCAGSTRSFYSGSIVVGNRPLSGAASLAPGAVDHLLLTASLPSTATGADFAGATSALTFTGTQRDRGAR